MMTLGDFGQGMPKLETIRTFVRVFLELLAHEDVLVRLVAIEGQHESRSYASPDNREHTHRS